MTQQDIDIITQAIENNGGVDPVEAAMQRLNGMEKEDLIKLVMIASNQTGALLHHDPYRKEITDGELVVHVMDGVTAVFAAYDAALGKHAFSPEVSWGDNLFVGNA